ncbi:hypothetical protein GCG21_15245 [Pseudactinotalea sp. HY160]|uniref:hypothetical protein n=1 Tax=Pseudactinotalea sp. HY160 TaxID=2654490 RepID=UPI00128DF30A|nr:hypothetical protein [Pseudactinotalea sp. HY160]MPV51339.1 hypothetical protein [Pseudactinotalea sp. HY160]
MRKTKKLVAGALMALMVSAAVATTAQAKVIEASRSGSYAYTNNAQERVYSKDTVCDNLFAAADWRSSDGSSGRVTNKDGCGKTVSIRVVYSPVYVYEIRACRSNSFSPVSCGDWES